MIAQENRLWNFIKAMVYLVDMTFIGAYLFAFGAIGLVWLLRG